MKKTKQQDSTKQGVAFKENGSWYHRTKTLLEDGTTKYSKKGGFKTEKEAEKSYAKYEEEFKKAYRNYQLANKKDLDVTLRDYLIYWFEEIFSPRVEVTSRMVSAYAIYNLVLPCMVYHIKVRYVNVEYLDSLLCCVAKLTNSAGNKGREILNMALKEAVIIGYIKVNPVTGTKAYPRKKPNIIILSKEKLKVFLKAASQNNWYLEILLALFCGLRKGEILGLKFRDFDHKKRTVSISRQVVSNPVIHKGSGSHIDEYGIIEKEPKSPNSYRTLRVPDVILEELIKRKALIEEQKQSFGEAYVDFDYISCQENGKPHGVTSLNNALTKLCNRNSLPHITVHGLRHMYATILLEMHVPLVKISALLGHSSVHTTFEYYCDVMDENENILAFMNNAFVPM